MTKGTFIEEDNTIVTGLLHSGLSVNVGSEMERFRLCLGLVTRAIIGVRRGSLSADAWAYNLSIVSMCFYDTTNAELKQSSVLDITGDWRIIDYLDIIVGDDFVENELNMAKLFENVIVSLAVLNHNWVAARHDVKSDESTRA